MLRLAPIAAAAFLLAYPLAASAREMTPDRQAFFGLYKELIETNTSLSVGSCTQAAAQIAVRMKAAGYLPDAFVAVGQRYAGPAHRLLRRAGGDDGHRPAVPLVASMALRMRPIAG